MDDRCEAADGDEDGDPPMDDITEFSPPKERGGVGMLESSDPAITDDGPPLAITLSGGWDATSERRSRATTSSGYRRSTLNIIKRVRIATGTKDTEATRDRHSHYAQCMDILTSLSLWFLRVWNNWCKGLTVCASIYELWSMGIWLAFLTEPSMKATLRWLLLIDALANTVVMIDCTKVLVRWLLDKKERSNRWSTYLHERVHKAKLHANKERARAHAVEATEAKACSELVWKILPKLILAWLMYPLQLGIDKVLSGDRVPPYLVPLILVFRMSRVGWATLDSVRYINRKEMDVYVDIRIQGTVGSSSSSWQVILKQFLIIAFWGHWVGCMTYALRIFVDSPAFHDMIGHTRGIPRSDDGARDFFSKFAVDGNLVGYVAGMDFGSNYLVSLYRGFAWNYEDVVPERPEDLVFDLVTMVCVVAIRSYCVGSFFKYQSLREMEQQAFTEQMESVNTFLDLCELPPSLKKAVVKHFEFQQEKRRDVQTLEVLGNLPLEIQMNLREHEYIPIVTAKNQRLFNGMSFDVCMQVCLLLQSRFMQPGEPIFLEGDAPRELIFLGEGSIALSRYTQVGAGKMSETLITYLRSERKEDPSILGEAAFLLEQPHLYSARVRAGAEAAILYITRQTFSEKLAAPFPEQHDLLMQNMAEMFLLTVDGDDAVILGGKDKSAEQEGEHFQSMQDDVRKHLIERKEALNAKFTFAASTGDSELCMKILAKKVDPNTSDYDKRSALHLAATEGNSDTITCILKASGDANVKDRWGSTPLQDALKNGFLGAAKALFNHGGKFGVDDPSGLLCACASEGDTPKMQQLLEFEIDVNAGDYDMRTALHLASTEGKLTVVAFLVTASADVNVKDRWDSTPLQDAIRNGYAEVASHLKNHGGRVDGEFASNLLCEAASNGNVEQLEMLCENGVDANVGDYDQRTPMHLAAAEGQILALSFLINVAHANHSPSDRWQATPLQDAISIGNDECVILLLLKGAVLGPSASQSDKEKVQTIKDAWCRGDGEEFNKSINTLRSQVATHTKLVRQGRARSDMFDYDEASKFNRLLLNRQIIGLPEFSQSANQVMTLLRRLDEFAVRPLTQMIRLLNDGAKLASEGHFWEQYSKLTGIQARHAGRNKDKQAHVFDQVAISTMSMAPILGDVVGRCVVRVLREIDQLYEDRMLIPKAVALRATPRGMSGKRSAKTPQVNNAPPKAIPRTPSFKIQETNGTTPKGYGPYSPTGSQRSVRSNRSNQARKKSASLSTIVISELLETLGWVDAETDLTGEREAFTISKDQYAHGSSRHQKELVAKLELMAAALLPGEHLSMTLQRGVLNDFMGDGFHKDVLSYGSDWTGACSAQPAPASQLAQWLQERSHTVASGAQALERVPPDLRPKAQQIKAFSPLLPLPSPSANQKKISSKPLHSTERLEKGGMRSIDLSFSLSKAHISADAPEAERWQEIVESRLERESHSKSLVHRELVATELVILGLCVLILEAWDKPAETHRDGAHNALRSKSEVKHGQDKYGAVGSTKSIPTLLITDLCSVFRKSAEECMGSTEVNDAKKKQLMEALRLAVRDAKRETKLEKKKKRAKTKGIKEEEVEDEMTTKADKDDVSVEKIIVDSEPESGTDHHIQMAKLVGMKGDFDTDEFALLLDFADMHEEKKHKRGRDSLFGAITRERFTYNLLRWVLNHEERQKEMMEDALRKSILPAEIHSMSSLTMSTLLVDGIGGSHKPLSFRAASSSESLESSLMSCGSEVLWTAEHLAMFDDAALAHDQISEGKLSDDEERMRGSLTGGSIGMALFGRTTGKGNLPVLPTDFVQENSAKIKQGSQLSLEVDAGTFRSNWKACRRWIVGQCSGEAKRKSMRNRISRRFRELDEDGEGVGVVEVSQLVGDVFHHTLGQDQELRAAHRMFELLEKDEIGELVTLKDFLSVLPKLEAEIKDQQRKNARRNKSNSGASSAIMKVLAVMVVSPEAWWLRFWDIVKVAAVVYYLVTVPIYFCFEAIDHLPDWQEHIRLLFDVFFDIFMVLNTVLNFFRSFLHPTRGFITNFHDIRVNYMLSFFFVDALACFPLDWISGSESLGPADHRGILSRPRPLARLVRLFHLRQLFFDDHLELQNEGQKLAKSHGFFKAALDLLKFAMALVHFVACIWWYLGARWDEFDPYTVLSGDNEKDAQNITRSSWIYEYEPVNGEEPLGVLKGPFWWQYLISFYWSSGRITQVGTVGNMWPGSLPEVAWCSFLFLLSFAVQGYVDGILAGKVMTTDESIIQALATSRIVDDYLHTVDLPDDLADQIRSSAGATATLQLTRRTEEVSAQLPHLMKQRLASRAFLPFFEKSDSAFRNCSRNFVVELGTCCKVLQVAKGSLLASVGEPATRLLILLRGRVALLDRQNRTFLETSRTGEMIGDVELIFDMKHELGARAVEESKFIVLDRAGFSTTCQSYPTDRITVQKSIIDTLEGPRAERTGSENGERSQSAQSSDNLESKSAANSMAKSTASSNSDSSVSVHSLRQRIFTAELQRVSEKTQQELKDARQSVICRFIDMAAAGDVETVKAFTDKNDMNVDEADYDLRTALHLATCEGHMSIVHFLVNDCHASLSVTDRFGNSPLDDALREKQKEAAKFLVDRGATFKADADIAGLMCQAAHDCDMDTLTMLVETVGISPNVADYDLRTPLHLGSSEGHIEVVQLLASLHGISMNPLDRFGNTPLDDAIRHQHSGVRRLLQERGGVMGNSQLGVELCTLAAMNDLDRLRELYESGVPMNQADYDHRTATHLAASNGHVEVMVFLLNVARVAPNPLDRFIYTPLDDARRHGRKAIEEMIMEYGGHSGSDPALRAEVEDFRVQKMKEQEEKNVEKLDKETNSSEIKTLSNNLAKFTEQTSFTEDVNTYVNLAAVYRKLLFLLLRHSALATTDMENDDEEEHELTFDKEGIERLLETTQKGIESTATRLDNLIERDLLPWVDHMTSPQARLSKLFLPSLRKLIERIQEHLKSRHELVQAVKGLWFDAAKSYQCTPLGLISNRFRDASSEQLSLARMDALSTLWLTSSGKLEEDVKDVPVAKLQRQSTASSMGSGFGSRMGSTTGHRARAHSERAHRRKFEQFKGSAALNNLVHAS